MQPDAETPLFTRTFDFLDWLLPMTNNFPRAHRYSFTQRLLSAAFDLRECLELANACAKPCLAVSSSYQQRQLPGSCDGSGLPGIF